MKARDVIGRRIVAVHQQRVPADRAADGFVLREGFTHIDGIVLDNGTVITFGVIELEGDYGVEPTVHRAPMVSEDDARRVACRRCSAIVGEACVKLTASRNRTSSRAHPERKEAARAAGFYRGAQSKVTTAPEKSTGPVDKPPA